jgi:hypothetical protein
MAKSKMVLKLKCNATVNLNKNQFVEYNVVIPVSHPTITIDDLEDQGWAQLDCASMENKFSVHDMYGERGTDKKGNDFLVMEYELCDCESLVEFVNIAAAWFEHLTTLGFKCKIPKFSTIKCY